MNSVNISKYFIALCGVFGCLLVIGNHRIRKSFKDYGPLAISNEEVERFCKVPTVCHFVGLLTISSTCISFFGILYENSKIIFSTSIFLILIMYGGLLIAYLPNPSNERIWDIVDTNFQNSFENYMEASPYGERATEFWDNLQQKLRCCGFTGPSDWGTLLQTKPPFSCCVDMNSECINEIDYNYAIRNADIYAKGCRDKFVAMIFQNYKLLQRIFTLYQISLSFGVVSSLWLTRIYKNKTQRLH